MVVGGCHFNQIHSDQVQRLQSADEFQTLPACQTTGNRCSGAGGKSRIESVDIEGQIDGRIAGAITDDVHGGVDAVAMHPGACQDFKPAIAVIIGAKTDLG